jgi:hypothetical protein
MDPTKEEDRVDLKREPEVTEQDPCMTQQKLYQPREPWELDTVAHHSEDLEEVL